MGDWTHPMATWSFSECRCTTDDFMTGDRVAAAGRVYVVCGLSGGVDSAVDAVYRLVSTPPSSERLTCHFRVGS